MDKINYSKCPLKKRPIYIINEEIEEGPIDLTVQKWQTKFKYNNNTKSYKEPSSQKQLPINYSTKLETIKEENYLNNYDYDKLQKITPSNYYDNDSNNIYHTVTKIENDEQTNLKQTEYNHYQNIERNFNNNFIKNEIDYQQYYNNNNINLPIEKLSTNKLQYNNENFEPEDLSTFRNSKNILTEHIQNTKYNIRNEFYDKANSNDLYYKCNICNKCYSTNSGLIKHQQCHSNNQQQLQQQRFDKINNLDINDNLENSINLTNNNNNLIKNHSQKLINIQRYQCQDCNKSYSTFSGLTKHQQFHCPNSEQNQVKKIFSCKNCDKVYVSLGALKMHIRTHTLPCKCPICGKAFSRPWLLQGHIRTHTGEKPFSCQHCNRAFADRSNLRAHLQTHSDIKKYSCTTCTKTFSRMSLLTKHLQGGCQSGIININDEGQQQNESYSSSPDYQNGEEDDSLYDRKVNSNSQSVIVQNNFYGNLENEQQQFNNYANENYEIAY